MKLAVKELLEIQRQAKFAGALAQRVATAEDAQRQYVVEVYVDNQLQATHNVESFVDSRISMLPIIAGAEPEVGQQIPSVYLRIREDQS